MKPHPHPTGHQIRSKRSKEWLLKNSDLPCARKLPGILEVYRCFCRYLGFKALFVLLFLQFLNCWTASLIYRLKAGFGILYNGISIYDVRR